MTATANTTMNRPGFTPVRLQFSPDYPETFTSYQGPEHGHVSTYLGHSGEVVVALDGLGNGREGMDLDVDQARALHRELGAVLAQLKGLGVR